jgi:hypothetical protein
MSGKEMIGLSSTHCKEVGVEGGDEADITLELDLEPRTVEPLQDLKDAL